MDHPFAYTSSNSLESFSCMIPVCQERSCLDGICEHLQALKTEETFFHSPNFHLIERDGQPMFVLLVVWQAQNFPPVVMENGCSDIKLVPVVEIELRLCSNSMQPAEIRVSQVGVCHLKDGIMLSRREGETNRDIGCDVKSMVEEVPHDVSPGDIQWLQIWVDRRASLARWSR